jgi:hypothetical protein
LSQILFGQKYQKAAIVLLGKAKNHSAPNVCNIANLVTFVFRSFDRESIYAVINFQSTCSQKENSTCDVSVPLLHTV